MQIKYRPEIDGLRAISVLAVILYHGKLCSGGYLGVDVFFIISGYLITAIILSDLKNKSFSFLDFYLHRVRRILPMLLLMTLVTLPFAWYFLSEFEIYKYAQSILAVELFVSNIWFSLDSGYFAPSNELVPLLHTWSLGVEEQFYLLWPLCVYAMWKYCRKRILVVISLLIIASLLLAQILSFTNRDANFFLLPSRIWELMSGALLAYLEKIYPREKDTKMNLVIPPICLMILFAYFAYIPIINNPNLNTCVPVIATLGLIWFAGKNDIATKVLTNKLFVTVGLISYSAYLWHQPILVFLSFHNLGRLSLLQKIAYIPATILISYFTWKYIEFPMRNRQQINTRRLIYSCILMMVILAICAILILSYRGFPNRSNVPWHIRKTIAYSQLPEKFTPIGDQTRKHIDFLIYGDSHTIAVYPAIKKAVKETHKRGVINAMRGCAPIVGIALSGNANQKQCMKRNDKVVEYVRHNKIHNVIMVGKWLKFYKKNASDPYRFTEELSLTLTKYAEMNVNVIILLQVPAQEYDIYSVYNAAYKQKLNERSTFLYDHSINSSSAFALQQQFLNYLQPLLLNNTKTIDPDPFLCDQEICSIGTEKKSYYADFNHLSPNGAMRLTPLFVDILKDMH